MSHFMLAKEYIEGRVPRGVSNYNPPIGWLASEKYDGYRAQYCPKKRQFVSRQNKPFNAPEWFLSAMPPDCRLDGELWIGRDRFQEMGVVRKKEPVDEEWMNIKYYVYDLPEMEEPFEERYKQLMKLVKKHKTRWNTLKKKLSKKNPLLMDISSPLQITKQIVIESNKHMDDIYKQVLALKGEGIMIKHPQSMYESKRSDYMLKYKPSFDAEGIIIDYKDGTNKYKGKLGAFLCRPLHNHGDYSTMDMDENHIFSISGMDDEVRDNYKHTHPIGTIINYEYSGLTNSGKPRFARYIRIRYDITLKDSIEPSVSNRDLIISIFRKLEIYEKSNGNHFKSRAYSNGIKALQSLNDDSELQESNLVTIRGLGKSLIQKISEIIKTGSCKDCDSIQEKDDPRELFMKIHGIGPVKANELMKDGVNSINELRNNQHLLNDVQKKGLLYYEDIQQRIPRKEIQHHEGYLKKVLYNLPNSSSSELTIAGSYRRGCSDSGDIDILINTPCVSTNEVYNRYIDELIKQGYLKEILSRGPKKCMGIARLGNTYRRVDLMYTKPEEYPFSILYFTGSDNFNVRMRQKTLEKGFTLNEYSLRSLKTGSPVEHIFTDEKSIFDYLSMDYVIPENR